MSWDYIIVGAGSAGCALAHELATAARRARVLVLESGGSDRSASIRFPAGQIRAVARRDWGYRSQPDPSRNGIVESWLRGRVLGGSSSINGTLYARGADADFESWAAQFEGRDSAGWSAAEVLRVFKEIENSDRTGPRRGRGGRLHVRTVARPHALTRAFVESACASGYRFNEDYNGESHEGVAYAQLSQRRGLRCSAADAFLRPLLGSRNVQLLLHATVERIELAGRRAVAVSFSLDGGRKRTEVARDIILCAGAIATPQLLMLSGIGAGAELRRYGIAVAVDLPGVGRNLQEHPLLRLTYRTSIASYNLTRGLCQKLGIAAQFLMGGEGPISNLFEAVAFLKSAASELAPDLQLHFLPVGYSTHPDGRIELASFPSVSVLINKTLPLSRGRIRLASSNPHDAPLIECRLLEAPADVETLMRGVAVVRRIMATAPIAALVEQEIAPGIDIMESAAVEDYVRTHTGIAFHPAGTCRMGVDADSVVSPILRVHGTENLWVADASIMPSLVSGNTNAACMMIGAKLGRYLAARRSAEVQV